MEIISASDQPMANLAYSIYDIESTFLHGVMRGQMRGQMFPNSKLALLGGIKVQYSNKGMFVPL